MRLRRPSLRNLRRTSQLLFLILFLILFRQTEYSGEDQISQAVNLFFRWDPLVALSVTLASRAFLALLLPSLIVVVLTMLLGRVFCGWVCPMGTLLDLTQKVLPSRFSPGNPSRRQIKYALLVLTLVSALFGLQLVGLLDPFSILVRGLTLAVDPALASLTHDLFAALYRSAPEGVNAVTEPVYSLLKVTILPYGRASFALAGASLAILLVILGLEALERRFWCRNLCPLGALLSWLGRRSLLRRKPMRSCRDCSLCWSDCRMHALEVGGSVLEEECVRCMSCSEDCPRELAGFRWTSPRASPEATVGLSRRAFLGATATGIVLPTVRRLDPTVRAGGRVSLRPPGALQEEDFLARCVRCGECMKVCIGNVLQPELLNSGLEGMFAPTLHCRVGYCEYYCTLCGQVCPTGAIRSLSLEEKKTFVIGLARFDKTRCLPFAEGKPCIVCEEHCPIHEKAIRFQEVEVTDPEGKVSRVKQPYVVEELCTGCGICEFKCPIQGAAGVVVEPVGEEPTPWGPYGHLSPFRDRRPRLAARRSGSDKRNGSPARPAAS